MRNLKSTMVRLGVMGLAATLLFSVSLSAANPRLSKEDAAKAAIMQALAAGSAKKAPAAAAPTRATQAFGENVTVGSDSANATLIVYGDAAVGSSNTDADLVVYGDGRFDGDLVVGAISSDPNHVPGLQLITGVQALNPKTQQVKVTFKDKTVNGNGAWVDFDFMTTATRKGVADTGVVPVGVRAPKLYFHPQATPAAIARSAGTGTGKDLKSTATWIIVGGPAMSAADFRLTPTIRHEAITNDIAIGFVPYSVTTSNGTSGYYDSGYVSNNSTNYYTYNTGLVSYRVVSDNIAGVDVITGVTDTVAIADVFSLFSDTQLQELLAALETYFGSSTKALQYLTEHRQELGAAVRALQR